MTNKEWLSTLPANKWYSTIYWLFHVYGKRFDETRLAVIAWLDEEHKDDALT